jgi:spore maturation protein SpmB
MSLIEIVIASGKSSVDIALYTLLPVMVVMLCLMKVLEAMGVMAIIVKMLTPVLKPFGLTGMSTFAMVQMNLISFAAPLATLAIMLSRGVSDRHLAATLAMLLAMGQGNILYPMIPLGLNWPVAIVFSIAGGLSAASFTWYFSGKKLSSITCGETQDELTSSPSKKGIINIINDAGAEAIRLSVNAVPMLTLSITIVGILTQIGAVAGFERLVTPILHVINVSQIYVVPSIAKYLGGGTAYLVVASDLVHSSNITAGEINKSVGFLIHTFDLPGIGIFLGMCTRIIAVFKYALPGILVGILMRTILHGFYF